MAKDSIELVLEASKKAIPDNIERLCTHETLMRNFLDMSERSTFSPKVSAEDKHLKAWLENMQKTGAERLFPNITTAANINESMRILLRERARNGTKLTLSVVWDHVLSGYQTSGGAGVENVDAAIQPAQGGRKASVNEMGLAEFGQEVAESRNTIFQLRKNADPFNKPR